MASALTRSILCRNSLPMAQSLLSRQFQNNSLHTVLPFSRLPTYPTMSCLTFSTLQQPDSDPGYPRIVRYLGPKEGDIYGNISDITLPFNNIKSGTWTDYYANASEARRNAVTTEHTWVPENIRKASIQQAFAIISLKGMQYKVTKDTIVVAEFNSPFEVGETVVFDEVLLAGTVHHTTVGKPLVPGCLVVGTIEEKTLSGKAVIFKKKKKKRYQRTHGHRRRLVIIRINDVLYTPNASPDARPSLHRDDSGNYSMTLES